MNKSKRLLSIAIAMACVLPLGCNTQQPGGKAEGMKLTKPSPQPPEYPSPRTEVADRTLRDKAVIQIKKSAKSTDPFCRAHAMEAAKYLLPDEIRTILLEGPSDPVSVVRFASLMTAGELRLADAHKPALRLINDPDLNVQVAAIFCLHKLGDKRFSHALEKMAIDPNNHVRANTAMLVGLLEERSGDKILRHQLKDPDSLVAIQAAEGLWRMGDKDVLEYLVSCTISRYPDDQMIAAMALAAPRDPAVAAHIRGMLTTPYAEVNLVAARAMGTLGFDEGYGVALEGAKSKDTRQRQLAAMAFGSIGRMDSQRILGKLLLDNDEDVRLAASSALLQLR